MRTFVAGSTGAIGKSLVPHLLESGHEVVALIRTPEKAREIESLGARVTVADALDREALTAAIRKAEPEVIIHQLTALAGVGNFKKLDDEFALIVEVRTHEPSASSRGSQATRAGGAVSSRGLDSDEMQGDEKSIIRRNRSGRMDCRQPVEFMNAKLAPRTAPLLPGGINADREHRALQFGRTRRALRPDQARTR
jgi:uncharacterized protein YbjT (DUF2867 family)